MKRSRFVFAPKSAAVKAVNALVVLGLSASVPAAVWAGDVFASSQKSAATATAAVPQVKEPYVPSLDKELTQEDADAMIGVTEEELPTISESELPPNTTELPDMNHSDDELAGMGIDQSVIDATKGSGLSERDEWACTCFLCLANPNGWRSVSECVSPVKRLFDWLEHHSMPKCPNVGPGNDMVLIRNPTDPCEKMGLEDVTGWIYYPGSGPVYSKSYDHAGTDYCVSGYQRSRRHCVEYDSEGYCETYATVKYYQTVRYNTHDTPYSIDIIIDNKIFNRTHGLW